MRAMILAAGLGTRLRPMTNDRPKALVDVGGRTMLQLTLMRLRSFGIREVIINLHHFADLVLEYLEAHHNFEMRIEVSREDVLLDTGGGLKKAAWFFLEDSGEPFILHNVDVLSTIDFARMLEFHTKHHALATLAVQQRKTSRYLLLDERLQLCGRRSETGQNSDSDPTNHVKDESVHPAIQPQALAFSGIHVISPRIFPLLSEEGVFSIISSYLRLAAQGESILGFRADEYYWRDLGRPENVRQAAEDLQTQELLPHD